MSNTLQNNLLTEYQQQLKEHQKQISTAAGAIEWMKKQSEPPVRRYEGVFDSLGRYRGPSY